MITEEKAEHIKNTIISLCKVPNDTEVIACIIYIILNRNKNLQIKKDIFLDTLKDFWEIED